MTQSHKDQLQIAVMLLVLVLVFGICTLPRIIHYVLYIIYHDYRVRSYAIGEALEFFYTISEILIVVNSSMNFVIYTTKGAKFRTVLQKMVCCRYKFCRRERRTTLTYTAKKTSSIVTAL